jgi:hypothetical protein
MQPFLTLPARDIAYVSVCMRQRMHASAYACVSVCIRQRMHTFLALPTRVIAYVGIRQRMHTS